MTGRDLEKAFILVAISLIATAIGVVVITLIPYGLIAARLRPQLPVEYSDAKFSTGD